LIEDLYIEGTPKTPTIKLGKDGLLCIQGRSIPEDARLFFDQVIHWVDRYLTAPKDITTVNINFEYLNSGTSKFVLQMLRKLKNEAPPGHALVVNWYYEEGDDDILERGEYYSSILEMKVNFIELE